MQPWDIGTTPKRPDEKFPITADFVDLLDDAETIDTVNTTITDLADGADASSAMKDGVPAISGTKTVQKVKAGEDGHTYRLEFEITTSGGKTLEGERDIYVEET